MLSLSIALTFKTVAVASTGRLLDVDAQTLAAIREGQVANVESVLDPFVWLPLSTETADNIAVCNPTANGANPGRFVRQPAQNVEWNTLWYASGLFIDGTNGNDEWTGTAATNTPATLIGPIKTDAERRRRMSTIAALSLTVTHVTPPSDAVYWETTQIDRGSVVVKGTWAVTHSGTFSAVQASAGNTMLEVTDGALNWAPFVGKIARISGGARAGNYFVIAKSVSAGVARLSLPFPADGTSVTIVVPAINDPYEILDQAASQIVRVAVEPSTINLTFQDLVIDPGGSLTHIIVNSRVTYNRCQFPAASGQSIDAQGSSISYNGCSWLAIARHVQCAIIPIGGSMIGAAAANARFHMIGCYLQALSVPMLLQFGALVLLNQTQGLCSTLQVMDNDLSQGAAVQVAMGSNLHLTGSLVGVEAAGAAQAVVVTNSAAVVADAAVIANMTIVGTAGAASAVRLGVSALVAFTDAPVMDTTLNVLTLGA